jgi:hypothetical protein
MRRFTRTGNQTQRMTGMAVEPSSRAFAAIVHKQRLRFCDFKIRGSAALDQIIRMI